MKKAAFVASVLQLQKPVWLPLVSLAIVLAGIFWLGQDLRSVAFLFWWEVILIAGGAFVRMFFALEGQPFFALFWQKLGLLAVGILLFGAMVALSLAFSIRAFDTPQSTDQAVEMTLQIRLLTLAHVVGLAVHFFANGRFRTASPAGELFAPLAHLLVLLAFLMAMTMHFLPKIEGIDLAKWTAAAVVGVKFLVDWLFSGLRKAAV